MESAEGSSTTADSVVIDGKTYPRSKLKVSTGSLRPWEKKSDEEVCAEKEEALKTARDLYVWEIFQMFDLDGSGSIDVHEFQELAFCLGETLDDDEAKRFVAEIDTDNNGLIEFSEFLTWWNGSTPTTSITDDTKLTILKLRLHSKAYMNTVSRLLARGRTALSKDGAIPAKVDASDSESLSASFSVCAGEVVAPKATIEVQLERMDGEPEMAAAAFFSVKDDAELDDIVNLLAVIKAGLGFMPKDPSIPNPPEANLVEVDGKKKIKISVSLPPQADMAQQVLDAVVIDEARIALEASREVEDPSDEPLAARLTMRATMPYESFNAIEQMTLVMGKTPTREGPPVSEISKFLKGVHGEIKVESVDEIGHVLLEAFKSGNPMADNILKKLPAGLGSMLSIAGWAEKVLPEVHPLLIGEALPEFAREAFYECPEVLDGFERVEVRLGGNAVALNIRGVNVFKLLPTREQRTHVGCDAQVSRVLRSPVRRSGERLDAGWTKVQDILRGKGIVGSGASMAGILVGFVGPERAHATAHSVSPDRIMAPLVALSAISVLLMGSAFGSTVFDEEFIDDQTDLRKTLLFAVTVAVVTSLTLVCLFPYRSARRARSVSKIAQMLTHPLELILMLKYKFVYSVPKMPTGLPEPNTYCYKKLTQVSRSFSAVILELPEELKEAVSIFYLVLRALDTIEDDMSIDVKKKCDELRVFYKHLNEPGWNISGYGDKKEEIDLLEQYHHVIEVCSGLDQEYQDVISDITKQMGEGMAEFAECDVATIKDYERYCFYVAGLVGHGLSRIFAHCGLETKEFNSERVLDLARSMGLYLQKTNITRDYLEDLEAVDSRIFYPKEIWGKYVTDIADLKDPDNAEEALECLNDMITNAMEHLPDCVDYMKLIQEPHIFKFCAIPQVMAIATLYACYNNHKVFEEEVKIRKGEAVSLIMSCTTFNKMGEIMMRYLDCFERAVPPADPNSNKMHDAIQKSRERIRTHRGY